MKKSQILPCGPWSWWGWFVFSRFIVNNKNNKNKRSLACIVFANRMNETFWLIMDFSLRLSSSPLTNMWELKQRRKLSENEKKETGLDLRNNNFARASHFFVHFFCCHCTTTTWKCVFSRFVEDVNTRKDCLSPFLNFDSFFQNSAPEKNCQHLRTNWKRWNKMQHDFTFL